MHVYIYIIIYTCTRAQPELYSKICALSSHSTLTPRPVMESEPSHHLYCNYTGLCPWVCFAPKFSVIPITGIRPGMGLEHPLYWPTIVYRPVLPIGQKYKRRFTRKLVAPLDRYVNGGQYSKDLLSALESKLGGWGICIHIYASTCKVSIVAAFPAPSLGVA